MKIFNFLDSIHAFTHTVCNALSNSGSCHGAGKMISTIRQKYL